LPFARPFAANSSPLQSDAPRPACSLALCVRAHVGSCSEAAAGRPAELVVARPEPARWLQLRSRRRVPPAKQPASAVGRRAAPEEQIAPAGCCGARTGSWLRVAQADSSCAGGSMREPHRTIIMSPCPHTRPHTLACVLAAASAWWSPEHELAVAEVWMCTNHQPRLPRTRAARSTTPCTAPL